MVSYDWSEAALAAAILALALVLVLELRSTQRLRRLVGRDLARIFEQLDLVRFENQQLLEQRPAEATRAAGGRPRRLCRRRTAAHPTTASPRGWRPPAPAPRRFPRAPDSPPARRGCSRRCRARARSARGGPESAHDVRAALLNTPVTPALADQARQFAQELVTADRPRRGGAAGLVADDRARARRARRRESR